MRSVDIVSQCENYFNGFRDIHSQKNVEVLEGVLKVFSYLLLLPAIVVGAIYFYNRKLAIIETKLDEKLHNLDSVRINSLYKQKTGLHEACGVTQQQLTEYLLDLEKNIDIEDGEMTANFQKGFRFLNPDSQNAFFQRLSSPDALRKVLDILPRDLEELHVSSGEPWPILHRDDNCERAGWITERLKKFTNLKTLSLDFRGVGFFSPLANSNLKLMLGNNSSCSSGDPFNVIQWNGTLYSYTQDTFAIISSLKALREQILKTPDLKYKIRFMNIAVFKYDSDRKGSSGTGVFHNANEGEFPTTIHNYLDTPVS